MIRFLGILILIAIIVVTIWFLNKGVGDNDIDYPNIIIFEPLEEDAINIPFKISGRARVFEGTVNFRILDSDNAILQEGFTTVEGAEAGEFGDFNVKIIFSLPRGETGLLEVFSISAKDGSEIDKIIIPLNFSEISVKNIKVFFSNSIFDPDGERCEKVFGVDRKIVDGSSILLETTNKLLEGPNIGEINGGYFTSINDGVKINSLIFKSNTIEVDFNNILDEDVSGSCTVSAIRAQIEETLKQFPAIDEVIISINGEKNAILQP